MSGFNTPWSNPFSSQFMQGGNPSYAGWDPAMLANITNQSNPINSPGFIPGVSALPGMNGFSPETPAGGAGGFMQNPWMVSAFGGTVDGFKTPGILGPTAGLATTGVNAYLGLENLDLAKKSLKFEKEAFSKQFENQRSLTNTSLRDRQLARDSSTGRNTTDSYMKENGV